MGAGLQGLIARGPRWSTFHRLGVRRAMLYADAPTPGIIQTRTEAHPMNAETLWEIPEPLSLCEVDIEGGMTTLVRRHGNPDADIRLVLSHGNGLAIDLYYPFWSLLSADFDLAVYDLRNHGWNRVGRRQEHNIPMLTHDHDRILKAIDRHFGSKPTVGVYHSLSALVSLLSDPRYYSALVLMDPPLCKPTANEREFDEAAERGAAMIRRRCQRFRSRDEFADLLSVMPGFVRVLPGVHRLMARTTLRKTDGGREYELRCPREYEAQIMEYVRSFAPMLDLTSLTCPTKVIGSDPTVPFAYMPSFDLSHILTVDYDFLPETTHYLQLEQPAECVTILREFLNSKLR
ncbi:MAG: alpha/beta hydrolase [Gammaproteobacteria bacterium]|nr:alpha/beta hydrolase [Gammaproteobacteria bacterium]MYG67329.1 alpha/beta hydrolase [Gammaproteobacteria bacterium]